MEAEFAYIEKCFSEISLIKQMPDKNVMLLEALVSQIERVLDRVSTAKLDAYWQTQALLHTVNVREDSQYRRTYTGFYKLRLPTTVAYDAYFDLLENQKINSGLSLRAVLEALFTITGRIETSFASKLLATINPDVPPLDREVMKHLGLRLPRYGEADRIGKCILTHEMLSQQMRQMVLHSHFQVLRSRFVARYPGYDFTDVKILDLVLWQFRVTKS